MTNNRNQSIINYTHKEQTLRTHTVAHAVEIAAMLIRERWNSVFDPSKLCLDSIKSLTFDTKITMQRLNDMVDRILDDTFIHNGQSFA